MNSSSRILDTTSTWEKLLKDAVSVGFRSSPRGQNTFELIGNQAVVDMRYPIILNSARKLNYRFMAAEAWWIMSAKNDVRSISKYCKAIANFSDDGDTFFGAYGPKIQQQYTYVLETLFHDRDSRQAVINIWRESPDYSKDIPCTLSVQWIIRENKLHCIDTMRSNDLWLGFPYDIFNFSMLSWQLAEDLRDRNGFKNLQLGKLFLNAGSHHLYDKNAEQAYEVLTGRMLDSQQYLDKMRDVEAGTPCIYRLTDQLGWIIGENDTDYVHPFFKAFKTHLIN